jgi:hypothetical protein
MHGIQKVIQAMTHSISGFIGRLPLLQSTLKSFPEACAIALPQDYGFVPITHVLIGSLAIPFVTEPTGDYRVCPGLVPSLIAFARHLSYDMPLAYIETEYFGGTGQQSALVWHDGQVILDPLGVDTSGADPAPSIPPLADFPINRALRRLGVQRMGAVDEFEALGLHHYRSNDSWLRSAPGIQKQTDWQSNRSW